MKWWQYRRYTEEDLYGPMSDLGDAFMVAAVLLTLAVLLLVRAIF